MNNIAIIGGGLAGLVCAWRLQQAKIPFTLYEASNRVGGRCETHREPTYLQGQHTELCGEFIDSSHTHIQQLVKEFSLSLVDTYENGKTKQRQLWSDQRNYSYEELQQDLKEWFPIIQRDATRAPLPTNNAPFSERAYQLDCMSVADYLNTYVKKESLRIALTTAMELLFCARTSEISSLQLIYLLQNMNEHNFHYYGASDERYTIKGGNDTLAAALYKHLSHDIQLNREVIRITERNDGRYDIHFSNGEILPFSHIVFAIPFWILRRILDSNVTLSPIKKRVIQEIRMGQAGRLTIQFSKRYWKEKGLDIDALLLEQTIAVYEATSTQNGECGILMCFIRGETAEKWAIWDVESMVQFVLKQLEKILPNISFYYTGISFYHSPIQNQWRQGCYSYYGVGQVTAFAGMEGKREKNLFFCGEHTSTQFQGYMNGAVESGERVANELKSTWCEKE